MQLQLFILYVILKGTKIAIILKETKKMEVLQLHRLFSIITFNSNFLIIIFFMFVQFHAFSYTVNLRKNSIRKNK